MVALIMMVGLLAACGGSNPTAAPSATNTVAAQQPTTAPPSGNVDATPTAGGSVPAANPTSAPSGEGQSGAVLADSGFRANKDGFNFRNFGNQYPDTPPTFSVEAARKLLGDKAICAQLDGTTCTPSAEATQWIDQMNKGINGGHCEGFAVASLQIFKGLAKPSDFGGTAVPDLQLDPAQPDSNPPLIAQIADGWTLQTLQPVLSTRNASFSNKPGQVLDLIIASMQNGTPDPLTLSFWKPGYKEGHAVVPIWVEDKGNSIVWLHIYDNNYPAEDKYIEFDRKADTWRYSTAADPTKDASAYLGDATTFTLAVTPLSARTKPPVCPFCKNASGSGLFAPAAGSQDEQVMLDGNAQMLFTDKDGHKFGYENGKFVSDIAGASQTLLPGGLGHDHGPIYNLPEGADYQATLEGGDLASADNEEVAMFGQGMAVDVQGIKLDKGQSDSLSLGGDGHKFSYKPSGAETPKVKIADGVGGKDYGFTLDGLDFSAGEEMDFTIDETTGKLAIKDATGTPDKYDLTFTEVDATGSHSYTHKDIELNPGDTEYIDFGAWQDNQPLNVEVDKGSDGSIDNTMSEPEQ